jgi:hypothetical protein
MKGNTMFKAIKLHFAWKAYHKANAAYKAYTSWERNKDWSPVVANALQNNIFRTERIVSALVNS